MAFLYNYEYEISTAFTSLAELTDLSITILQIEIDDESIITPLVHHILANIDDDTCIVYFETELTPTEEDKLDEVIAAHTGEYTGSGTPPDSGEDEGGVGDLTLSFGSYDKNFFKFAGDSWTPSPHFIFRGTNQLGTPIGVQAVIYSKDDNDKYFDLRVFDSTNNQVIFDWINMHSEKEVWKVFSQPVTTGWPAEQALLELQGRKSENDGCDFYVSFFMIQFSGTVPENLPSGVS